MKTWDDWSDKDVNKAVEKITGMYCEDVDGRYVQTCDYCNDLEDMWPIIFDRGIGMTPMIGGDFLMWKAHDRYFICEQLNENPLRAAAIVFLEMNGVKP